MRTFVGVVPINRIQTDDCQLVRNDFRRIVCATLEYVILFSGDEIGPDAIV
jgi:hypothetical protein